MRRREFMRWSGAATPMGFTGKVAAQPSAGARTLRIGYQKNGVLVIARRQATLERRLGVDVTWSEFSSGPPLLEAMNAGSVDIGQVGDTPPIFAQAAGAAIVYVAGQPSTNGQAILVKQDSPILALADLKGKRIGFTEGSAALNVTLMALEKAKLSYADMTPVQVSPQHGAAAFARDSIDAWAIWDPYFAIGQAHGGRILVPTREIGQPNAFYIGNRDFAARHPQLLRGALDTLAQTAGWAQRNRDKVAQALAEVTGVDPKIERIAAACSSFAIGKLTGAIIATQQAVADRFRKLDLIPRSIVVRDAVWSGALA